MSEQVEKVDVDVAVVGAGSSTQPEDEETAAWWTPAGAIHPPADLEQLAKLTQVSPIRRSCIAAIVHNTVGLGVSVVPREGREGEAAEGEGESVMAALDAMARRDKRSGSPNFRGLLRRIAWDKQEVGNGALEVARNRIDGQINGLFHAPGKRVRRTKDAEGARTGYVIGPRNGSAAEQVRYYDFAAKVAYEEGKASGRLTGPGMRWDRNELLVVRLYTSESRDYGLPPDSQLAADYLGDSLAVDQNIGYFDNGGVPPTLVFLEGEVVDQSGGRKSVKVSDSAMARIQDVMRRGPRHAKLGVVALPPGVRGNKLDLAVLSERDMGFVGYRADNRRRTLGAWRLSPVFVADIEDAGKYTAEVERAITKEQVFDGEQEDWRDELDVLLIDMGKPHLTFAFAEIRIDSDESRRASANDAARAGVITNGEFRARHGLPPLPEATGEPGPGEVPAGWNGQLLTTTAAALPGPDEVAKATSFERQVRDDFEAEIAEAMSRVAAEIGDEWDLAAVKVERDGERIVVEPVAV